MTVAQGSPVVAGDVANDIEKGATQNFLAQRQASLYDSAYNAMARVHGQDTADMVFGNPSGYDAASQGTYRNALAEKAKADTAHENALTPGAAAAQSADTAVKQAQASGLTQQQRYENLGHHLDNLTAEIGDPNADRSAAFDRHAAEFAADQGIPVAQVLAQKDAYMKDPMGFIARERGMLPTAGPLARDPATNAAIPTKVNPLDQSISPVSNPAGLTLAPKATGAAKTFVDPATGNEHSITTDAYGGVSVDGVPSPNGIPAGFREKSIYATDTRADTSDAALAERTRADKAREDEANKRIAIAERMSAPLDPQTRDYLSDQVRLGNTAVLGRMNSAQRASVYQDAAQKARDQGDTGAMDAANAQVFQARKGALNELNDMKNRNATGSRLVAAETFLNHVDTFRQIGADLGSNNVQLRNAAMARFKQEFGKAAPATFNAQKRLVSDELGSIILQNGGTAAERERFQNDVTRASSPDQLSGVLDTWSQDMGARVQAMRGNYQAAGLGAQFDLHLQKRTRTQIGLGIAPPAPSPAAPAPAAPPAKAGDFSHLWR